MVLTARATVHRRLPGRVRYRHGTEELIMLCADEGCGALAEVTVDFGGGLVVLMCWPDAVTALIEIKQVRVTRLPRRSPVPVTRPREA